MLIKPEAIWDFFFYCMCVCHVKGLCPPKSDKDGVPNKGQLDDWTPTNKVIIIIIMFVRAHLKA